ncbi:MAG: hypothetical protein HKO95_10330 [Rhodobacteraceae bacterium]|nr:hypothetical protein [Alphaproteobacteria bacterium]MBT8475798.1 hypothetical protein [Alphaproteobacteria bacterium]NNK67124.1 hypothetical protein [Paracoccaceae bacterium]
MPDHSLILDAARALHLIGLALGIGLAFLADLTAWRALFRPLYEPEHEMLHRLHNLVACGIILLWISGLVILWHRTGFQIDQFSPKLIAKLTVVTMLTFNAFAIARFALPALLQYRGYCIGEIPMGDRLRLGAIAGLSTTCWVSALALGVFSRMKTMSYAELTDTFAPVFAVILGASLVLAILSPLVARIASRNAAPRGAALR